MERSLFIIKPNAMRKKQLGEIISILEKNGLVIKKIKIEHFTRERAEGFYEIHKGKPFFQRLIDFMISGPVTILVLEHENCVDYIRRLIGSTDPSMAEPGTIRKMYADNVTENAVHASDSLENAEKEIAYIFG